MAKLTPEIYQNLDRNFLVVDLEQAEKNAAALRQLAGKSKLAAVVKADAYGHGLLPCARAFWPAELIIWQWLQGQLL